jgi:hypothetical protein
MIVVILFWFYLLLERSLIRFCAFSNYEMDIWRKRKLEIKKVKAEKLFESRRLSKRKISARMKHYSYLSIRFHSLVQTFLFLMKYRARYSFAEFVVLRKASIEFESRGMVLTIQNSSCFLESRRLPCQSRTGSRKIRQPHLII